MQQEDREEKLKKQLREIVAQENLTIHQEWIKDLSIELGISILDCAAALSLHNQPNLTIKSKGDKNPLSNPKKIELPPELPKPKLVRYRLNVGRKHQASFNEIKDVLIEVAGIDRKGIGKLDIRNYYTLVDLPDGMPADIFFLLSETEIQKQKLNIKRIKYQRRYHRRSSRR